MTKTLAPALGAVVLLAGAPALADEKGPAAGYNDGFYVRDADDAFRFYPRMRLNFDAYGFFGPGVRDVPSTDGGIGLTPRLFVRRARLEMGADLFHRRVSVLFSGELGGQPLSNTNGKTEQSAAAAGKDPTASSARYAPVQSVASAAAPADAWVNVRVVDELNFMIGQYQAPFSMENRTSEGLTPFMERNLPIRAFVVPAGKETGVTAWGDLFGGMVTYEAGMFGGDGQNRPQVDARFDWAGRLFMRPFVSRNDALAKAQIGVSGRFGLRDPKDVAYDYPQITTGQGFVLWDSTYKDSKKQTVHVIPSGPQSQVGGELRVPVGRFALQGEAYYVANGTREALDGYQLTNTERLGALKGVGWYAQLSAWPAGDAFLSGDPGTTRPRSPDLTKAFDPTKQGFELLAIVGGVNAHYDGASRGGVRDAKTPAAPIVVYQYGFGASYWWTRAVRVTANYILYHTPGSGSADNLAAVPGNLAKVPDAGAHLLHELGARVAITL